MGVFRRRPGFIGTITNAPCKGARIRAMPSTHISLHYHIVFCTKGRRRIIAEPWREELHAYIGGITRDLGAVARSIGGTGDHVTFWPD